MSKGKRVASFLSGIMMILLSILMFYFPELGMLIIVFIISFTLLGYGTRLLTHYSTLSRHMVGGKVILYLGMVIFNLGILTLTAASVGKLPVFIYLFILFIFTGALDVMKAFEEKKNKARFWFWRLLFGLLSVTLGILSVISCFVLKSSEGLNYLFCTVLVYSGFVRIIKAFRKTAVVYIQ